MNQIYTFSEQNSVHHNYILYISLPLSHTYVLLVTKIKLNFTGEILPISDLGGKT